MPRLESDAETELAQADGSDLLPHSSLRSDGLFDGTPVIPLKGPVEGKMSPRSMLLAFVAAWIIATVVATSLRMGSQRGARSTCTTDSGATRWPLFASAETLEAHSGWSTYFRAVYGGMPPPSEYPICLASMWLFYAAELTDLVELGLPPLGRCPTTDTAYAGQFYVQNSRLQPANLSWAYHPPEAYEAGLPAGTRAEVLHQGGLSDEHTGAWFLYAKGSGIWLDLGQTIVFGDHDDSYVRFNVTHLAQQERNEAMSAAARAEGYDTIQFTRHTCPPMYGGCINQTLAPTLRYFNLEIVSTKLTGVHPCASADGRSPLITTGWRGAGGPCTCDNNASAFLHCDEVPFSARLVVDPIYQQELSRMSSMMQNSSTMRMNGSHA